MPLFCCDEGEISPGGGQRVRLKAEEDLQAAQFVLDTGFNSGPPPAALWRDDSKNFTAVVCRLLVKPLKLEQSC